MPQWKLCTWVPGHYTSPSRYVDPSQIDDINVSSPTENLPTGPKALPTDSYIPLANDPAQNVAPTATPQSGTTMTSFLATTAENTSIVISNGNIQEVLYYPPAGLVTRDGILPLIWPKKSYEPMAFPLTSTIIRETVTVTTIYPLSCGRRFIGKSIKTHLENFIRIPTVTIEKKSESVAAHSHTQRAHARLEKFSKGDTS
ncbi:hypothetical protein ARMGADRAFT_1039058 [Armillaria gallica]|uniref:Uncharacterized protein n=1 Tax=Armillaria gallica TaxID=47427 RepID=A0A2H3CFJ2_ARMGA|nr:hypothetical protein ARMGADRAFT_1039058 [Armillaria gallica]